jgi:hypothetical protein
MSPMVSRSSTNIKLIFAVGLCELVQTRMSVDRLCRAEASVKRLCTGTCAPATQPAARTAVNLHVMPQMCVAPAHKIHMLPPSGWLCRL